ncbi:MAG TPA: DUF6398 domain-containing protein [Dehalococcoidia bacterium]|nr:DUF6398 domain-containing protein [Dehalococcoidia bacterium]
MARIRQKSERVPKHMQPTFDAITTLTGWVCQEHLDEEYAQLARQAAAALCRKRPSPLCNGRTNSWACGIIYALGFVNFLFDSSREPYISAGDLCLAFGVSISTGSARSRDVRQALKMSQFDANWCLPSRIPENSLIWMLEVDGIIVDIRWMSRQIQEIAFEKGMIPYIPADREGEEAR